MRLSPLRARHRGIVEPRLRQVVFRAACRGLSLVAAANMRRTGMPTLKTTKALGARRGRRGLLEPRVIARWSRPLSRISRGVRRNLSRYSPVILPECHVDLLFGAISLVWIARGEVAMHIGTGACRPSRTAEDCACPSGNWPSTVCNPPTCTPISGHDVHAAGFGGRTCLLAELDRRAGALFYRIAFRLDRPNPCILLAGRRGHEHRRSAEAAAPGYIGGGNPRPDGLAIRRCGRARQRQKPVRWTLSGCAYP